MYFNSKNKDAHQLCAADGFTVQLICAFVFAYAKRFSHGTAQKT